MEINASRSKLFSVDCTEATSRYELADRAIRLGAAISILSGQSHSGICGALGEYAFCWSLQTDRLWISLSSILEFRWKSAWKGISESILPTIATAERPRLFQIVLVCSEEKLLKVASKSLGIWSVNKATVPRSYGDLDIVSPRFWTIARPSRLEVFFALRFFNTSVFFWSFALFWSSKRLLL